MLVSLAAILVVNLGCAEYIDDTSQNPHFMQMHSGEIDSARLLLLRSDHNVDDVQVMEFLNMDGTRIRLGEHSLANSVQDNGFSMQSQNSIICLISTVTSLNPPSASCMFR